MKLLSPVAITIFNRPKNTEKVFREIAKAKPSILLVVADGPRPGVFEDLENCRKAREVTENVDWDCKVFRNYADVNLGCKKRMSSGLDWVFNSFEEAIILEDDCLPSQSFFRYCQELLEFYREDTRIMQICGSNLLKDWKRNGHSYFFSSYGPIWGWASWRRAWKYYDVDMKLWPEIRENRYYEDFCQNIEEAKFRLELYDKLYLGEIDTWDYQWGFAKMINNGLSVISSVNLISNIGFTDDATHTMSNSNNPYAEMETFDLNMLFNHPQYVVRDCKADQRYLYEFMGIKSTKNSIKQSLLQWFHRSSK